MRYLVTGASGLVGSGLVRHLVDDGQDVSGLVRPGSRLDLLDGCLDRAQVREGDLLDPGALADAMEGVTHVFHCAAHVGFPGPRGATLLLRTNVDGTANVVNAALRAGVTRLVHTSSVAAIGRPERDVACLDESASWSASRFNTSYGRSKYLAELEIARGVAEGLDCVIVNPSLIFGRGISGENTWAIVERVRDGRLPAYPAGSTNVVDVEDVIEGLLLAMRKGIVGQRYILAGDFMPWKDVLGTLALAFDATPPGRRIPPVFLETLGLASEWFSRLARRTPRLTREGARVSSTATCYDSSRAQTELGWSHRPFSATAQRLAALGCLLVALAGCGRPAEPPADHPVFVATFHAMATIAQAVAGDRAEVITLLDPGVSPHAYEPRPSDLRRIQQATATVYASDGLDSWLVELGVPSPIELFAHVPDSLRIETSGFPDPHFWLSPMAVAATLDALADHFCAADSPGCDGYRERALRFAESLRELDGRLSLRMAPSARTKIVVASSFLSYFLSRYGPDATAVVEVVEGVEPSPAHLQIVTQQAQGAKAVVGQPWLPENASKAVAEAASIPYVSVDPLGNPSRTPTYEALLVNMANALEEATRGR